MSFTPANPFDNGRVPVEPNDGRPDPPPITTDSYYQKSCGAQLSLATCSPVQQGALYCDDTTQFPIPQTPEQARKDEGTLSAVEPQRFMYDMHPYSIYPYEASSGQFTTFLPTRYYNYWVDRELQYGFKEVCPRYGHPVFDAALSNIPDCPHSHAFVSITDEAVSVTGLLFAVNDHTSLVCQGWATFEESPYIFNPEPYPPSLYYVAEHLPIYKYINLIYKYDRTIYKGNKIAGFEIQPSIAGGNDTFPAEISGPSFTTVFEAVSTANSVISITGGYSGENSGAISGFGTCDHAGTFLADYLTAEQSNITLFEFDAVISDSAVTYDAPMQFVREEFTTHFETSLIGTLTVQVYPNGTATESAIVFAQSGVYCVIPFTQEPNVAEHLVADLPIYHIPKIFEGDVTSVESLAEYPFPAVIGGNWYEESLDTLLTLTGFNFGNADDVSWLAVCESEVFIPRSEEIFIFLELGPACEFDIHQSIAFSWPGDESEIGYVEDFYTSSKMPDISYCNAAVGEPAIFGVTTYFELTAIEQEILYSFENNTYLYGTDTAHVADGHPATQISFEVSAVSFPASYEQVEFSADLDEFFGNIEYENSFAEQVSAYAESETLILSLYDETGSVWKRSSPEIPAAVSVADVGHYYYFKLQIDGVSELSIGYSAPELITGIARVYQRMKECEVLPFDLQEMAELGLSTATGCNRLGAIASVDWTGYPFWKLEINGLSELPIGYPGDYVLNGMHMEFRKIILNRTQAFLYSHELGKLVSTQNDYIPIYGTVCEDVYAYDSLASAAVMAGMYEAWAADDIVHAFVDYFDRGSTYIPGNEVVINSNSGEFMAPSLGMMYNGYAYTDEPFTWGWIKTAVPQTYGFVYKDIRQFNDRYAYPAHAIDGLLGAFLDCRNAVSFFNATMQAIGSIIGAVDYNYADSWILWGKKITHYDTPMDIVVGAVNDFSQPLFYSGIMEVPASATEAPGLKSIFVSGPDTLCTGLSDTYNLLARSLYPNFVFSLSDHAWEASSQKTGFVCMNALAINAVEAPSVHAIDSMVHRWLDISGSDTLSIGYSGNYGLTGNVYGIFGVRSETAYEVSQTATLCMLVTGQLFAGIIAPDIATLSWPMPDMVFGPHVVEQLYGILCYPDGQEFDGVVSVISGKSEFPENLFAITGTNTLVIGQNGPYLLNYTDTSYDLSFTNFAWPVSQNTGVLEVSVFENGAGAVFDTSGEIVGLMSAEIYGPDTLTSGYSTNETTSAFGVTAYNPPALSWDAHAVMQEIYGSLHVYHRPMPIYGDVLEDAGIQVTSRTVLRITGSDILSIGGTLPYGLNGLLHEQGNPALFPIAAWAVSQHMGCLDLWAYTHAVQGNAAPAAVETTDTGIIEILGSDTLPIMGKGDYELREIFIGVIPIAGKEYTYYETPFGEVAEFSFDSAWTGKAVEGVTAHATSASYYFYISGKNTLTISYSDQHDLRFTGYDFAVDQNRFGSVVSVDQSFTTLGQGIFIGLDAQIAQIGASFGQGILEIYGSDILTINHSDSYDMALYGAIHTPTAYTINEVRQDAATAELGFTFVIYRNATVHEDDLAASFVLAWLGISGSDTLSITGTGNYKLLALPNGSQIPATSDYAYVCTEISVTIAGQFASSIQGSVADILLAIQHDTEIRPFGSEAGVVVQLDGISGCLCHDQGEFDAIISELWAVESNPMAPRWPGNDVQKLYRLDTLGCLYNFQWCALLKARDSIYKNYPQYVENGVLTGWGFADCTITGPLAGHSGVPFKGVKTEFIMEAWIDSWYRYDILKYHWSVYKARDMHSAYALDMSVALYAYHWEIYYDGVASNIETGVQQAFTKNIFEIFGSDTLTIAENGDYALVLSAYGSNIFDVRSAGVHAVSELYGITPITFKSEFTGIETSLPVASESGFGMYIFGTDTLSIGRSAEELLSVHYKFGGIGAAISDYAYEVLPVEMGRSVLEHRLPMLDATEFVVMYAPSAPVYMSISGSDTLSIAHSDRYLLSASVFSVSDMMNKKFDYLALQHTGPFCLEEHISQPATFWENGTSRADLWSTINLDISGSDALSIGYDGNYQLSVTSWSGGVEVPVITPVAQLPGQLCNDIGFDRMKAAIPVPELEKGATSLADLIILGNPELSIGYDGQYDLEFFLRKSMLAVTGISIIEMSNLPVGELLYSTMSPVSKAIVAVCEAGISAYDKLSIFGPDSISIGSSNPYALQFNGLNGEFAVLPITVEQLAGTITKPIWSFPGVLTEDFIGTSNYAEKDIHFGAEPVYYDSTTSGFVGEFRAIFFWSWGADDLDYNIGHVHVADTNLPVWNIHDIVVVASTSDAKLWLGFEGIPLYATTDPIITIVSAFQTAGVSFDAWYEPEIFPDFEVHQAIPLFGVQLDDDSVRGTETPPRLLPQLNWNFWHGIELHDQVEVWFCYHDHIAIPMCGQIEQPNVTEGGPIVVPKWYIPDWWERVGNLHAIYGHEYIAMLKLPESIYKGFSGWRWRTTNGLAFADVTEVAFLVCKRIQPSFRYFHIDGLEALYDYNYGDVYIAGWYNRKSYVPTSAFYCPDEVVIEYTNGRIVAHTTCEKIADLNTVTATVLEWPVCVADPNLAYAVAEQFIGMAHCSINDISHNSFYWWSDQLEDDSVIATEMPPRLNPQLNWDFWHGVELHDQLLGWGCMWYNAHTFFVDPHVGERIWFEGAMQPAIYIAGEMATPAFTHTAHYEEYKWAACTNTHLSFPQPAIFWEGHSTNHLETFAFTWEINVVEQMTPICSNTHSSVDKLATFWIGYTNDRLDGHSDFNFVWVGDHKFATNFCFESVHCWFKALLHVNLPISRTGPIDMCMRNEREAVVIHHHTGGYVPHCFCIYELNPTNHRPRPAYAVYGVLVTEEPPRLLPQLNWDFKHAVEISAYDTIRLAWNPPCQMHLPVFKAGYQDCLIVTEEPPRLNPQLNWDFWHGIEIHEQEMARWEFVPFKSEFIGVILDTLHTTMGDVLIPQLNWNFKSAYEIGPVLTAPRPGPQLNWHCHMWADALNAVYWVGPKPEMIFIPMIPELDFWFDFADDSRFTMSFIF